MKRLLVLSVALLSSVAPAALAQRAPAPTYEQPLSAKAVHDVQVRLHQLGYYGGPTDGVWGAGTRDAVEQFQASRHLAVTGQLNQATVTAMGLDPDRLLARGYEPRPEPAPPSAAAPRIGPETTRAVQTQLRREGFYRGPVDGVWGRSTRAALAEFQRARRLPITGEPSRETLAALGLNPESYMSGSSTRADELNREELERRGRY
jgi:peptidoglycan hydrolase-like protein with peptidoglycan-binding domain